MKNTLTKALSLILTACFIMSLCVCTTAMAADNSIAEKTLKYFDEETWTEYSFTDGTNTLKPKLPEGISSIDFNNLDRTVIERVTGAFGNASEDASLKLSAKTCRQGRNTYIKLFECTDSSSHPVNVSANDTFTIYADLATDSIPAGYTSSANGLIGLRVVGAKTAGTKQTTDIIWFVNNGDETYSIYSHGSGATTKYTLGEWVNVAVEVTFGNGNASCKTYVNGTLLGESSTISMTGLSYIMAGYQQATATVTPNIYINNVAFYKGEYSADHYKAIEAASALSVSDIRGGNADLNNIESNLNLITEKSGSTITWTSSNEDVISTTGVVTPSATEDTAVTLTATVTNGAASEIKAYTVNVPQNELITFDDIKGKNVYEGSIVSNLVLPAKLRNETAIYWTSSNENVISTNGNVTRNNDASHSVKLTAKKASDNSVVKEFNLYVIGDDIVNDSMNNFENMIEHQNLSQRTDSVWRISGAMPTDGTKEVYAIYNAAPGANVQIDVARYGGDRTIQLWCSADGVEYTQFTNFAKTLNSELIEFAQVGAWKKDVWNTNVTLPEGTRYLKVRSGSLNYGAITNIKIAGNVENDVTFADIANGNTSSDAVMTNLDLSSFESVTSSDEDIIAEDGKVTRPEKDTVVTITAKINNEKVTATKIFTLTVLGTKEEAKSEKPWILYNDADGLALISNSTLAKDGKIEFDADVFYAGNESKTATGIIAIFGADKKLIEVKTVDFALSASASKQRVSTELTLTKETEKYSKATVHGYIWEKGTLKPIGDKNGYTAK